MDLSHFAAGDHIKNSGIEAHFLVDTGATCSIINYTTYREIDKLQNLDLYETLSSTRAVNGNTFDLLGYTFIVSSFDREGSYKFRHKVLVSSPNGSKPNKLGKDFIHQFGSTIDIDNSGFLLKAYAGQWVSLSHKHDKPFPYVSRFHAVPLTSNFSIAPKSTRVFSVFPSKLQIEFAKGTYFALHRTIQYSGVFTFNVQCMHAEKQLPTLINNPNSHQILLNKGILGFICHDLSIRGSVSKKYRMTDNVASMEAVAICSEELLSFFEICSMPQSVEQVNSGNESDSLGLTDELPTDFSREAKSLKPEINSQDSPPLWTKDDVAQKMKNFS